MKLKLAALANSSESCGPEIEKTCNSEDCSQEWVADQKHSKSASTTHPGGHKRIQSKHQRPHVSQPRSVFMINNNRDTSGKMTSVGEFQGENLSGNGNWEFCAPMKFNFSEGFSPVTSDLKLTENFIKNQNPSF